MINADDIERNKRSRLAIIKEERVFLVARLKRLDGEITQLERELSTCGSTSTTRN
jgi:hypothetical protein